MTAINLIVQRDGAHLFTDGAFYDGGRLTAVGNKVELWPAANAAFAVSGQKADALLVSAFLAARPVPRTINELLDAFRDATEAAARERRQPGPYRAILGGWSAQAGAFGIHVHRDESGAVTAQLIGEAIVPALPDAMMDTWRLDPAFPGQCGAVLMQAQRQLCPTAAGEFVIGGFCQHTCIDGAGIATGIVATWHDTIGEAIRP